MKEYQVKVKDLQQDLTHVFHEWAESQTAANAQALEYLKKYFHHDEFEIA